MTGMDHVWPVPAVYLSAELEHGVAMTLAVEVAGMRCIPKEILHGKERSTLLCLDL